MDWRSLGQKKLPHRWILVACAGGLGLCIALLASTHKVSVSTSGSLEVEQPKAKLSLDQLHSRAKDITVKVLSADVLGSGFLIKKQGEVYTVLTNAHVLRAGDPPYRIQTPDGHIYSADLPNNSKFKENDLAMLQFRSPRAVYPVASLGKSSTLAGGQQVFASGFAESDKESQHSQGDFKFTSGKVYKVLDKALEGGYKVGYTNDIKNGMSGGPLLNQNGEVVGVNGKHAYPIWDTGSVFQDGSKADPKLQQTINHFSWAVPIETAVQLAEPAI